MKNIENLKQLGLSDKEARVYLSALEYGPTTLAQIAQKAGIKRTTIYEFLDDLLARGVLIMTVSGKRAYYTGLPPENLEKLIEKQKEVIQGLIPELSLLTKKNPASPKVRFYEGVDGMKHVYSDTLTGAEGEEALFYSNFKEAYETMTNSFWETYTKKRVEKRVLMKGITPDSEYVSKSDRANKKVFREVVVVPEEKLDISNEIIIYSNKVAIISLRERVGIIVESQQIADTQRKIFNLLWESLRKK